MEEARYKSGNCGVYK